MGSLRWRSLAKGTFSPLWRLCVYLSLVDEPTDSLAVLGITWRRCSAQTAMLPGSTAWPGHLHLTAKAPAHSGHTYPHGVLFFSAPVLLKSR